MSKFIIIFLSALLVAGCKDSQCPLVSTPEIQESAYKDGLRYLREGRLEDAFCAFMKVTECHKPAPESYLELGRLYLKIYDDPIAAIYCYRKYLETYPKNEKSPMVLQLIETAKKEFAKQLPGQPHSQQLEKTELVELLRQTREENQLLKDQISALEKRLVSTSHLSYHAFTPSPTRSLLSNIPNTQPPPHKRSTYKVEAGDTLSKISTKVYGSPKRWNEIYEANKSSMPSSKNLKIGQELIIP